MFNQVRILILDASRYDGLVMRRELSQRFPSVVITLLTSAELALKELASIEYSVAIIDNNTLLGNPAHTNRFNQLIKQSLGNLGLISLKPELGSESQFDLGTSLDLPPDSLELTKSFSFHRLLPALVNKLILAKDQSTAADPNLIPPAERKLDLSLDSLPARLAHEINNPLMTILGQTELLLGHPDGIDRDLARKLKIIRRSANRIKGKLDDLAKNADQHAPSKPAIAQSEPHASDYPGIPDYSEKTLVCENIG